MVIPKAVIRYIADEDRQVGRAHQLVPQQRDRDDRGGEGQRDGEHVRVLLGSRHLMHVLEATDNFSGVLCLQSTSSMPETEQSHKESLRPAWQDLEPALARALEPALPGPRRRGDRARWRRAVPDYSSGVEENVRLGVRQALDGFVELVLTGSDARPSRAADLRGVRRAASTAWAAPWTRCFGHTAPAPRSPGGGSRTRATERTSIPAPSTRWPRRSSPTSTRSRPHPPRVLPASSRRRSPSCRRAATGWSTSSSASRPAEAAAIESAAADAEWKLPDRLAVLAFDADAPGSVASRLPVGQSGLARWTGSRRGHPGP